MIEPIIGKEFPQKVIPLIREAKNSIDIIVYDWRWYPDQIGYSIQLFNQALIQQARKNVKIRAILESQDVAKILNQNGIEARVKTFGGIVHTKLMLIDNEIVIIGSHNYTYNAFETNFEASVLIRDKETNRKLTEYFQNLWL